MTAGIRSQSSSQRNACQGSPQRRRCYRFDNASNKLRPILWNVAGSRTYFAKEPYCQSWRRAKLALHEEMLLGPLRLCLKLCERFFDFWNNVTVLFGFCLLKKLPVVTDRELLLA